jgi:hypothetical protein
VEVKHVDPSGLIGTVTTRAHLIDNFDSFILDNIPYAEVPARAIRWGSVEYDGPAALGIDDSKPALQWHFGGVPYPITKAIRIPYTYVRTWDGSNAVVPASIFLGFQDRLTDLIPPQPIPYVGAPGPTFDGRAQRFGPFGTFSNMFWGSDAAILASEALAVITRSVWRGQSAAETFQAFIEAELNICAERFNALVTFPTPVDFDGPAQDNNTQSVWQYTPATLLNEPAKYSQLLHWYFAGKSYSVTKAMRVWLDTDYSRGAPQPSFVKLAAERRAQAANGGVATSVTTTDPSGRTGAAAATADLDSRTMNPRERRRTTLQLRDASTSLSTEARVQNGLTVADAQGFALFIGFGGGSAGENG